MGRQSTHTAAVTGVPNGDLDMLPCSTRGLRGPERLGSLRVGHELAMIVLEIRSQKQV